MYYRYRKISLKNLLKKDKPRSTTKTVWMPRREYKKYFAHDTAGNYIGTEPQRQWTEDELQEKFGQYHKDLTVGGVRTQGFFL
jgi:hypothetical protein